MSFAFLNRFRRTIGFQLTLWYSMVFIVSCFALFALAYFSLSSSLQHKDKEFIHSELVEYATRYEKEGLDETIKEIEHEKNIDGHRPFIVRISNPQNKTLYLSVPKDWQGYDLTHLEEIAITNDMNWIHLPKKNDEDRLDIGSMKLQDENNLQIGANSGERNAALENFLNLFSIGALFVVLVGFIGGAFLAFRWLRPIKHLTSTIKSILETGQMNARVPSQDNGDELDELGSLFNRMLGRIELLVNGMRESLDNVAHDLRTPMTRLRGIAEGALQSEKKHEVCQEALADSLEESEQVTTMLKTLMDISEAETGTIKLNLEKVDVSSVIQSVTDIYNYVAEEKQIVIKLQLTNGIEIEADRNRLKQVFGNLLDNAIKYSPNKGYVEISSSCADGHAVVTLKDSGIGIPSHETTKIWGRLYRGDQSRTHKGLGLGLSLVKAIVESHKGQVQVVSMPGQGSTFSVSIPLKQIEPARVSL